MGRLPVDGSRGGEREPGLEAPGDIDELQRRVTRGARRHLPLLVPGKDAGAWPVVRAVLDPRVRGGQLWGPRVFGPRGTPRREPVPAHMADPAVAADLWAAGGELVGADPHLGFR